MSLGFQRRGGAGGTGWNLGGLWELGRVEGEGKGEGNGRQEAVAVKNLEPGRSGMRVFGGLQEEAVGCGGTSMKDHADGESSSYSGLYQEMAILLKVW